MQEAFMEASSGEQGGRWNIIRNGKGEETLIEFDGEREYDTKTLANDLPDLEERIEQLEREGWKVFTKGSCNVVLERVKDRAAEE